MQAALGRYVPQKETVVPGVPLAAAFHARQKSVLKKGADAVPQSPGGSRGSS